MRFEERDVADCIGWQLAHSILCGPRRLGKATTVSKAIASELRENGVTSAQVFMLEDGDLDEDTAALRAAELSVGDGLIVKAAGRGRANLIAACDGVFVPGDAIDTLNALSDAFSAASARAFTKVQEGDLVATIKLVPYGVAAGVLSTYRPETKCEIAPFTKFCATLLVGGTAPTEKTLRILSTRLSQIGGAIDKIIEVDHEVSAYATALASCHNDLILMIGASAISDRYDTLPSSVEAAGGRVEKVGMPADPGNLLMLARLGTKTIIGMPGCARSPALNGFDWVLQRYTAGLPLNAEILSQMGTGGLLKEPADRAFPRRTKQDQHSSGKPKFSAILLAAGRSSRSGETHKLLSQLGQQSVIEKTADLLLFFPSIQTVTVTGDSEDRIRDLLGSRKLQLVHNKNFRNGMGSSIAVGIQALSPKADYTFICLGDMPFIRPSTIDTLMSTAADAPESSIIVPTFNGKRGHPVVWGKRHFKSLSSLNSEVGGREIIRTNSEKVIEVEVDDPGILIDLDTPEMLAQFGIIPTTR